MSVYIWSARFAVFAALVLGTAACSKTNRDSGRDVEAVGAKGADPAGKEPEKDKQRGKKQETDAELIQGTWTFEWREFQGKKEPGPGDAVLIFHGDKLITKELTGDRTESGPFRLDQTKTPRAIEIGRSERDPADVAPGIYELNGDLLRICFVRDRNGKRPTAFESSSTPQTVVWVLKRDRNAPEYKEPDVSGYAAAIVGKWKWGGGATAFPFFRDTEFTKDGRVLQLDPAKKEWVETYKYRLEKSDLVLLLPQKDRDGRTEQRVKIASISDDQFVAASPSGTLKRLK